MYMVGQLHSLVSSCWPTNYTPMFFLNLRRSSSRYIFVLLWWAHKSVSRIERCHLLGWSTSLMLFDFHHECNLSPCIIPAYCPYCISWRPRAYKGCSTSRIDLYIRISGGRVRCPTNHALSLGIFVNNLYTEMSVDPVHIRWADSLPLGLLFNT